MIRSALRLLSAAFLVSLSICACSPDEFPDIPPQTDPLPVTSAPLPETEAPLIPAETTADSTTAPPVSEAPAGTTTPFETTAEIPPITDPDHISVASLTLDKYAVSLTVGGTDMPWVTMLPADATDKSEIWQSDNPAVATVNRYGRITGITPGSCTVTVRSADNKNAFAAVAVTVKEKIEPKPTYIDGILIVNKSYALPKDYTPSDDPAVNTSLEEMFAAAAEDGIKLFVFSGYRTYAIQEYLYNFYVDRDGKASADRFSARPGHSEHQSGLAFDINTTDSSFADSPEAKWLEEHCHSYGFILRYPRDKEEITGYMYEPWHIRYVGKEKASAIWESGLCLEEYLKIKSSYAD